jgi:hypothetical protein
MNTIDKFMGIAFTLIALGLIITNDTQFNTVVSSISKGTTSIIGQLQAG